MGVSDPPEEVVVSAMAVEQPVVPSTKAMTSECKAVFMVEGICVLDGFVMLNATSDSRHHAKGSVTNGVHGGRWNLM